MINLREYFLFICYLQHKQNTNNTQFDFSPSILSGEQGSAVAKRFICRIAKRVEFSKSIVSEIRDKSTELDVIE